MASASRTDRSSFAAWVRGQTAHVTAQLRHVSPKGAASANLAALLLVTIGMSLWQPLFSMPRDTGPMHPLAPAPAAVKMIDAAPRGGECREQTWPYIDQRCLNYGKAQPEIAVPAQSRTAAAPKRETSRHAPANVPQTPRVQETRIVPAAPAAVDSSTPALPRPDSATMPAAPSTDDVRVAGDEPVEYAPTEEELRAQERAEARQRRRARQRDFFRRGHFWIGPFRF